MEETENVIKQSDVNYRVNLNHELNCMSETELWKETAKI